MLLLFAALAAHAEPQQEWITPWGAGELTWGTPNQPLNVKPRPRDLFLPDAGYIGRDATDRPDDLEVVGPHPHGERRFLRYVHGKLVDAWIVRESAIDGEHFASIGEEQWVGPLLGPADAGFRAYGDAMSWMVSDRTVLYWRDRMGDREILVSRAQPSGQYAVVRAESLRMREEGTHRGKIKGDLKAVVKAQEPWISGCLNLTPKPVEGTIELVFDNKGQPGRIRANTDQPAFDVIECFGAALVPVRGTPASMGSFSIFRFN